MRAAVGQLASEQILNQAETLGLAEDVVGFHGVAADGLGDHVFSEAELGGLRRGLAEFVNDVAQELRWIIGAEKLRQRINLECAGAERLKADAGAGEGVEMLHEPVSVLRSDFERDGEQQSLRRDALTFHAAFHFLEKNPLMRGVLIHENEARSVFHEDVKFPENAE